MNIGHVGVVGAGQMGAGIAQICAAAGLRVTLCDLNEEAVERGVSTINISLNRLVKKEKIVLDDAKELGRPTIGYIT